MRLIIRNKLFSIGGGSIVQDEKNKDILKVRGKVFTITRKKFVCDLNGKKLYTVRNKFWRFFFASALIYDENKKKIAHIKQRLSMKSTFVSNVNDLNIRIGMGESLLEKVIYFNEEKVATYYKSSLFIDSFELQFDDDSLAPLLTAIIIALDNIHDDNMDQNQ